MDGPGVRVLVASSLGGIVEPAFRVAFAPGLVTVAVDERQIRRAIAENLRYDVVVTDLTWNDAALDRHFDGLDVLDLVERTGRAAPVVFAMQGHGVERDLVEEAAERVGVAGIVRKADGVGPLITAIGRVAGGEQLDPMPAAAMSIHRWFAGGRRGETAGRMAGAIAAGRASHHESLADAARCSRNTAAKVADKYLGPLIRERGEHPPQLPITTAVVYRWCGEHARYLASWCRRHGHADVLGPSRTGSGTDSPSAMMAP